MDPLYGEIRKENSVQSEVDRLDPLAPKPEMLDELSLNLLDAVRHRDQAAVRLLVDGALADGGAKLSVKNANGQTPLHLAVHNDDISMVQLLLERGADPDATAVNGNKPLYDAAESGCLNIVELLLEFNAHVEAFNVDNQRTAFYQAVENGHLAVAKVLLRGGAFIDAQSATGLTPLFCAVRRGDVALVEYLLEHGANKKLHLDDDQTVEDFAKGNVAITDLLRSSQVIQGPSLAGPKASDPDRRFTPLSSLPADQVNKQGACHGFEASIIDFFLGDREERIQVSASIYDVLYGKGAEAIMNSARGSMLGEQQRQFRWYHLPANNVLISRIFTEQNVTLDEELKSKLGLPSTAGREYRTHTAQSSFMRPLCHYEHLASKASPLVLFMPYLHFETLRGYQEMAWHTWAARNPPPPGPPPGNPRRSAKQKKKQPNPVIPDDQRGGTRRRVSQVDTVSTESDELVERKGSTWKNILQRTEHLRSTFQDLKGKLGSKSAHLTKFIFESSADEKTVEKEDLEKGTAKDSVAPFDSNADYILVEQDAGKSESMGTDLTTAKTMKGLQIPRTERKDKDELDIETSSKGKVTKGVDTETSATAPIIQDPTKEQASIFANPAAANRSSTADSKVVPSGDGQIAAKVSKQDQHGKENFSAPSRSGTFNGKDKLADIPEGSQPRTDHQDTGAMPIPEQPSIPAPRSARKPLGQLDELLVKAYAVPTTPGQPPPLQLRRTLDQYFYTHLESTFQRDTDQVVFRYTRKDRGMESKIFMVDQLWLWVLNGDTVISCFPQRWDIWSTDILLRPPPPPPPVSPPTILPEGDVLVEKSSLSQEEWRQLPPPPPGLKSRRRSIIPEPRPPPQLPADLVGESPSQIRQNVAHQPEAQPLNMPPDARHRPPHHLSAADAHDDTNIIIGLDEFKRKKSKLITSPSPLLTWMAGKKSKGGKDSTEVAFPVGEAKTSRPTSSIEQEEKRKRRAFLQLDPLNVHQTILKHLQRSTRAPITSAYGLAELITTSCVDVFDQYKIPPDFQFFDFFERSIGALIDQETQCFKYFMNSLDNTLQPVLSIAAETRLLVEIKDIRDELGILEMILNDQLKALGEFEQAIIAREDGKSITQNKVLLSHLERIQKMNKLGEKTYQALNDLLDLKQKEFNVSEARKQAEITSRHVEIANQSREQSQRQVSLAEATAAQAEETARQGRTVMLFTVVTIIFLPLGFMAAFFAINVDSFPVNSNGKLPMRYVLKYMLSISAAISIPFVLVAFNQETIAKWLRALGKAGLWWLMALVVTAILSAVIWTSHLASGIKAAVTITIVLFSLLTLITKGIYALLTAARSGGSSSSGYESSRSLASN